jgi:hypothetical protein
MMAHSFDVDRDYYMQAIDPLHYDIDKDISVEMVTNGNSCYVSIYNDRNDKSVAFQTTKDKLKGLADFLSRNLGNN